jgi:hypothetical protein
MCQGRLTTYFSGAALLTHVIGQSFHQIANFGMLRLYVGRYAKIA